MRHRITPAGPTWTASQWKHSNIQLTCMLTTKPEARVMVSSQWQTRGVNHKQLKTLVTDKTPITDNTNHCYNWARTHGPSWLANQSLQSMGGCWRRTRRWSTDNLTTVFQGNPSEFSTACLALMLMILVLQLRRRLWKTNLSKRISSVAVLTRQGPRVQALWAKGPTGERCHWLS